MILSSQLTGALLPIWLPLAAAPIAYLLRRRGQLAALLSAAVIIVAGYWLIQLPPTDITLLERPLSLSLLGRVLLVALAGWLALAFLFAGRVSQGRTLFPFLLTIFSIITSALLFNDLVIRVLLLKVAWLVVILLVQGGIATSTRAASRLLILSVLALPPFLVAVLLINESVYQPQNLQLPAIAIMALGLGFALMLAVLPFHAWLPHAAEEGPPLVAAWLSAGMIGSYLVLLIELMTRYPWLGGSPQVQRLLFTGGLLMAIGGALLAVTEDHLGRLWAYLSLADLGYVLLGLSIGGRAGMSAVLFTFAGRLVSLLLSGAALATIRHRATSLRFDDLAGVGGRLPLSMMSFLMGSFALLGLPLTPGFPGHWAVLRLIAQQGTPWLWALLAAVLLGIGGVARALAVMTTPESTPRVLPIEREPVAATALLLLMALLSLVLALAPQSLNGLFGTLLRMPLF